MCRLKAARIAGIDQMNMPAFQRKFPCCRNVRGEFRVRLLAETRDLENPWPVGHAMRRSARRTLLDVAEARTRPRRLDADGDKLAGLLCRRGRDVRSVR